MMKLVIAMPSGDHIHADTAICLALMVAHTSRLNLQLAVVSPRCSIIQKGRYEAVVSAQKLGANALLFVDSDMTFPPDTAVRLLRINGDIAVATYTQRREPFKVTARYNDGKVVRVEKKSGLREIAQAGTGMMLIDMNVFKKLEAPYFDVTWDGDKFIGEDYNFCDRAREAGCKIICDMDLSKEIGHIGTETHETSNRR